MRLLTLIPEIYLVMSSAYNSNLIVLEVQWKSFMWIRNKSGPKTEPLDTP